MKKIFLSFTIISLLSSCKDDDKIIVKSSNDIINKRELIVSQVVGKDSTTHTITQIIWCNNEIIDKTETTVKTVNLPKIKDTVDYQSGKKKIVEKEQKYPIYVNIK